MLAAHACRSTSRVLALFTKGSFYIIRKADRQAQHTSKSGGDGLWVTSLVRHLATNPLSSDHPVKSSLKYAYGISSVANLDNLQDRRVT